MLRSAARVGMSVGVAYGFGEGICLGAVHDAVSWVRTRVWCRLPLWRGGREMFFGREASGSFWLSSSLFRAPNSLFGFFCFEVVFGQTSRGLDQVIVVKCLRTGDCAKRGVGSSKRMDKIGTVRLGRIRDFQTSDDS
jgi:hypothetical protein